MKMEKKAEIMPIGYNLMVLPYESNPYMENKTEEGFLTTDGQFFNEDSGEKDVMKQEFLCGQVIEVGHKCELVQPGDDVLYHTATVRPVPFRDMGFILVAEQNLIAVLGENLKERVK